MTDQELHVVVTDIGEYINQQCCERSFKLRLNKGEEARHFPFYPTVRSPLNPILAATGRERERELGDVLTETLIPLNPPVEGENVRITWDEFLDRLGGVEAGQGCFAREVEIGRTIGNFVVSGRMDFVVVRWVNGSPSLRIVECKASRKDKTYHRIQLAAYRVMVQDILDRSCLMIGGKRYGDIMLESVVARIDEESNEVQDALELSSLDLQEEMDDLRNLLSDQGPLWRVAQADLKDLPYRLDAKCDACVHCPICLPESARRRKLELLGLDQSVVRILREVGVHDVDALADLDPGCEIAHQLRGTVGFGADLDDLIFRAKARRSTLAGRREGDWGVMAKKHPGVGLLPVHEDQAGNRLVRVYLDVEYDYIEDRLVGLAAHVTDSDLVLLTKMPRSGDGAYVADPRPSECTPKRERYGPLKAVEVVKILNEPWASDVDLDDRAEGELIQSFFDELVGAIHSVGGRGQRPLHFYVWSHNDMVHLIDACSRSGGPLLHNLTELLGCRAECQVDLEQMIYTALRDEVDQKVHLGYTGQSLAIATSLLWFGFPRFHWVRIVGGEAIDLEHAFRRDIFDFRTSLFLDERGEWCDRTTPGARREYFEIRTRFGSDINAPYWYAMWGILPEARGRDNMLPRALEDYRRGGTAELISAFLAAKCQALRWVEERMFKNYSIAKPFVPLGDLKGIEGRFAGRYDLISACLDFLRLDHYVKKTEWLTENMRSPAARVAEGSCIPLRGIIAYDGQKGKLKTNHIAGQMDLDRYSIANAVFFSTCTIDEGSFVRVTPYTGDPDEAQKPSNILYTGVTARIDTLNYDTGAFNASIIPNYGKDKAANRYVPTSFPKNAETMNLALVGESVANFSRARVDTWLNSHRDSTIAEWFNPESPKVPKRDPIYKASVSRFEKLVREVRIRGRGLDDVQVSACLDGLKSTVQLLLGPPGTGKTNTTAVAVLLRLAARKENKVFLLSANTHTAVEELTGRMREALPLFEGCALRLGVERNDVKVLLLTGDTPVPEGKIGTWDRNGVLSALTNGDVVLCGSVNEVLKIADRMSESGDFKADGLIVDEASMMVFADFLALATLVAEDGEIMLAGDHMQLAPITSHDWENETREQVLRLTPHESAYQAMRKLCSTCSPEAVRQSALTTTYRLTPELTHLISGVYEDEGVILRSVKNADPKETKISSLSDLWSVGGIFLVVHDEAGSRKSNEFEAELIRDILASRGTAGGETLKETVSIITPHRAQRGVLRNLLEDEFQDQIKFIDTVERLQGGECETIIVSGTQSDPAAIAGNAEFILDLNRTNVIFSRAKERLIVVCSRSLLDSMPADIDDYGSSWLWKHLRLVCDTTVLRSRGYEHEIEIRVPSAFWVDEASREK